jgi:hypothetical protein
MSNDALRDAKRAIYLDFESIKEDPPRPALLGILVASDEGGFEQLVLDPILAGAAKAKARERHRGDRQACRD